MDIDNPTTELVSGFREVLESMADLVIDMNFENQRIGSDLDHLEGAMRLAERMTKNMYAALFMMFISDA